MTSSRRLFLLVKINKSISQHPHDIERTKDGEEPIDSLKVSKGSDVKRQQGPLYMLILDGTNKTPA